jgi:gliding motility-associated-like protein
MKKILLALFFMPIMALNAQTVIWSESFDPAPAPAWFLNNLIGTNDPDANFWNVSDDEGGVAPGGCGVGANGNNSLHVSSTFNPTGGAAYNAGGLCGFGIFCVETNTRTESPNINTVGLSNITLNFDYIENGDGAIDDFFVQYSTNGGTTWQFLANPNKTSICANTQGLWGNFSILLPPAANNIPNLKLGFVWINNDDGAGSDPSVAINDIELTVPATTNQAPNAVANSYTISCGSNANVFNVLANDIDPDLGQTLGISNIINTGNQSGIINNGSTIFFTPNYGFVGNYTFQYVVCDNGTPSLCDTATINVTVNPGCNNPPTAVDDNYLLFCNSTNALNVLINDFDIDGDAISISNLITTGTQGTVSINGTGNGLNYIAPANFNGTTTFQYVICDNNTPSLCDTALVNIDINNCNNFPQAIADNYTICLNSTNTLTVLSNDTDPDGNPLSINSILIGSTPALFNNINNTIIITPNNGYTGNFSFQYIVCDNGVPSLCDTATVNVSVVPCNPPPVANPDFSTVTCVSSTNIPVLLNDTDPNNNALSITGIIKNGLHGIGTIVGNAINYATPMNNCYNGNDTLIYTICDNGNPVGCDTSFMVVTIQGCLCNIPPNAINDVASGNCNLPLSIPVLVNDSDPNAGQNVSIFAVINNSPLGTGAIVGNNIVFTPNMGVSGTTTLQYVIADNGFPILLDTATISIMINNVNCNFPPVAVNDALLINCTAAVPNTLNVLNNDTDPDAGQSLVLSALIGSGINGVFAINGNSITYTLNNCGTATDSVQYVVCDNSFTSMCDTAWVIINTNSLCNCNAPIAGNDFVNMPCNTTTTISPIANDVDADAGASLSLSTIFAKAPSHGIAVKVGNNLVYTPNICFLGKDTILYIVNDLVPVALYDTGMIVITVSGSCACSPPVAIADNVNTPCNTSVLINPVLNDFDPDGTTLNLQPSILSGPLHGTASLANSTITYTPNYCYDGKDTIIYSICDSTNLCDTGIIVITIAACNCQKPTANFMAVPQEICEGQCVQFTDQSSDFPASWQWSFPGGVPSTSTVKNPGPICYNTPGVYDVTLIATNVIGASTPVVKTGYIKVNANPPNLVFNIVDTFGTIISLPAVSGGLSFVWSPASGLSSGIVANPTHQVLGNITYVCNITTDRGCKGSTTYNITGVPGTISLPKPNMIWVPDAFSPNNDAKNDTWGVKFENIKEYSCKIFNRWGQLVFDSADPNKRWNGTTSGTDVGGNQVFFYKIIGSFNDGEQFDLSGDITTVF